MSLAEIAWRVQGLCRDLIDSQRVARGYRPASSVVIDAARILSDDRPSLFAAVGRDAEFAARDDWRAALLAAADDARQHRFSYFEIERLDHGDPIDWHRDHSANRAAPVVPSAQLDYRDFDRVGDCKLVWEPNRHYQLVVLARAWRVTGDAAYARAMTAQMISWMDANPFGFGMNWRNPLELGVRLINWIVALDLTRDSGEPDDAARARIAASIFEHCWEATRKYSRGSSANNHLIGEVAGVFVACAALPELPNAAVWRDEAARILEAEIVRQTYPDGCTREHAFGYQLFVMQFFVVCRLVGERTGHPFGDAYDERLRRMIDFALALMEPSRSMPKLGDCDDGYVLDLGEPVDDFDTWHAIRSLMFGPAETAVGMQQTPQTAYWLFGPAGVQRLAGDGSSHTAAGGSLRSRAFTDSGYALVQTGDPHAGDTISVLFDCAELGYGSIAAHGHADALSFVLRAYGEDVLVDPGTYDYFSYPEWRRYFRSTAAHNTVRVDRTDQSTMLGPFLWGRRAHATLLGWEDSGGIVRVDGSHDGYATKSAPIVHRRGIVLDEENRRVDVLDELDGTGAHELELFFHFSDRVRVVQESPSSFAIVTSAATIGLELDGRLSSRALQADSSGMAGWISPGYHRKSPSTTVIASGRFELPVQLTTRITIPART